jgi:hypothetical protein
VSRAIPPALFDRLNILLTRRAAWQQTRQTIAQRYDQAYQTALKSLESIRLEEWALGARFAAYHGEYRTIATIFRSHVEHQAAYLDEIRRGLGL